MSTRSPGDEPSRQRIAFRVLGMDCASCTSIIGKALKNKPGIYDVEVSYMTETAYIDFDPEQIDASRIENALRKSGYEVVRRQ